MGLPWRLGGTEVAAYDLTLSLLYRIRHSGDMNNGRSGYGAYLGVGDSVCYLNGDCKESVLVSPRSADSLTAPRPRPNVEDSLNFILVDRREIDPPPEGSDHDMVHHVQAIGLALRVISTPSSSCIPGAAPSYVVIGVEIRWAMRVSASEFNGD